MIGIGWEVVEFMDGKRHVVPAGEHHTAPNCHCNPTPEADDEDVIVHHSADRREDYETGIRKPS